MGDLDSNNIAETSSRREAKRTIEVAGNGIRRFHELPRRFEDDYRLTKQILGAGSFATVCLAVDRHTGGKFAVKRLTFKGLRQSRVLTEAAIVYAMDHPNIVRVVDMYQSDEALDIVMECMEGGELFARLADCKRFKEVDAAQVLRQILSALSYVHGQHVAHRDIKLENLLYEKKDSDHLKVADFGLAKVVEKGTTLTSNVGTEVYCAPEVRRKDYSTQCDMYSLGVVAHALLIGMMPTKPLGDGFDLDLFEYMGVSPLCKDFVKGLLRKDPNRRLTAQQALAHPWLAGQKRFVASPRVSKQVLSGLKAFGRASPLRKACMSAMAWSLGTAEQAKVRDAFAAFDRNHTGVIEFGDMEKVLVKTLGVGQQEASSLLSILDTTGDKTITYSMFSAAMCARMSVKEGHVRDIFRRFDCDDIGSITAGNLKVVLQRPQKAGIHAKALIAEADYSGDGTVTFGELSAFLRRGRCMLCLSALVLTSRTRKDK